MSMGGFFYSINMDPVKLKPLSDQLVLSGKALMKFVTDGNNAAREDRARERSLERLPRQSNSATPAPQPNHNLTKLKLLLYNEYTRIFNAWTQYAKIHFPHETWWIRCICVYLNIVPQDTF